MSRLLRFGLLALGLCLVGLVPALAEPAAQPGGATPAEVLTRLGAAFQAGDRDSLAQCCSTYDPAAPDTAKQFVDIVMLAKVMQPVIIAGVKKYGAADFRKGLGDGASFFDMLGIEPPTALWVTKGVVTIDGDTAEYKYTVSKDGKELLPAQPELAKFMQSQGEGWVPDEMSMDFVKSHDRWYVTAPTVDEMKEGGYTELFTALTAYCPQVQQAIDSAKDSKAFANAMKAPNAKLMDALPTDK